MPAMAAASLSDMTAAAAAPSPAPAPSPAQSQAAPVQQVASAVITIGQSQNGSGQVTLQLHPADLGGVQVRIERSETGAARISISAEKTDTLSLLQGSLGQLHQTLDAAGIAAAGREIVFHPVAGASPAAAPGVDAATTGGDPSQQTQPDFAQSGGQGSEGGGRAAYPEAMVDGAGLRGVASREATEPAAASVRNRAGLDILA